MFSVADIPAFREQILANASFIYRSRDQDKGLSLTESSRKFEIVTYAVDDGKGYAASLLDLSSAEVVLTGAQDANFVVAVHNLFDETCGRIGKVFGDREKAAHEHDKDKKGEHAGARA